MTDNACLKDLPLSPPHPTSSRSPLLLLTRSQAALIEFSTALSTSGFDVVTACRIADVERWPIGGLVVTDADSFTPLWKELGAIGVVVLVQTREEGILMCRMGADAWALLSYPPDALVHAVESIVLVHFSNRTYIGSASLS